MSVNGEEYIFYHYTPSLAASAAFAALFGISAIAHATQLTIRRTWYFIPFVIGGLCKQSLNLSFSESNLTCRLFS